MTGFGGTARDVDFEGQGYFELMDGVYTTGKPFVGNEMLVRNFDRGNGRVEDAY